jgi:S-adenosyl methyltransferase
MQQDEPYSPPEIDTKSASGARVYDYVLGGTDNYAVDRMVADQAEAILPGTKAMLRNNRRFLERAVHYLAGECGIRQFIDIGSGLPTQNNVHQIAQRIAPQCRVVYVDSDPVVLAHQKVSALTENENTAFVLADARNVEGILGHPGTHRLIDFSEPAAVLCLTFLHFIPDSDDPWGMVHHLMNRLAPGSYLAISHIVSDHSRVQQRMTEFVVEGTGGKFGRVRDKQEVKAFFEGLVLVEPGLVDVNDWHPDGREEEQTPYLAEFGGLARKPA